MGRREDDLEAGRLLGMRGCADHGCRYVRREGQGTNGGCRCHLPSAVRAALEAPRALWAMGDPRELCVDMRLAVMDEDGNIWGASVSGEHTDDGSPMTLWRDGEHRPCEWLSSWLWMRVPSRAAHFDALASEQRMIEIAAAAAPPVLRLECGHCGGRGTVECGKCGGRGWRA